jgi:hypothetical protein
MGKFFMSMRKNEILFNFNAWPVTLDGAISANTFIDRIFPAMPMFRLAL